MQPAINNCDLDFKTVFCNKYDCRSDEYQRLAFMKCLGVGSKVIVPFLVTVFPSFFSYDLELIEKVGRAMNHRQVHEAISNYYLLCRYKRSVLHNQLHLRISCSKLQKLAFELLKTNTVRSDLSNEGAP